MQWIYLMIAGIFEVVWSVSMKLSEGFTIMKFTIITVLGMILSFAFLAQATKSLPLGTAYAIWTGIGALGAVIIAFNESANPARLFFALVLLVGIIGLKLTS